MHLTQFSFPASISKKMSPNKTNRRGIFLLLAAVLSVGAYFAWEPFKGFFIPAVPSSLSSSYVCIPTGSSFDEVVGLLKKGGFIRDEVNFRWLAEQMNYRKSPMRAGRFEVQPGWTNRQLIQHLRSGKQSPADVVLNMARLPEDVAGIVSRFIEADSMSLLNLFRDNNFLQQYNLNNATLVTAFIPNTYEMYWNTDAKGFLTRMVKERDAFWDKNDRKNKAQQLGLTEEEVYTLASIVERETNYNPEKPTIAGVYLNRLRINMKLQADPTCVFATRDFAARRVTDYHTNFDSPYNTYMYKGLPPGPISMASIPSIDAVLNAEKHNYLYFCARPDDSGQHVFAETFAAHKVNADRFQAYVRQRNR